MKRSRRQSGSEGNGRKRRHCDQGRDGNAIPIITSTVTASVISKGGGEGCILRVKWWSGGFRMV